LNFTQKDECEAIVISGGGGSGLLNINWFSESSANKKITKYLEELCKEKKWIMVEKNSKV